MKLKFFSLFSLLTTGVLLLTHAGSSGPYFWDVNENELFYHTANRMAELGITSGCAPGYYCPGDPATRGQMAVFIIRALCTDNFTYASSPVYFAG